jgi:hypothetical protein
VKKGSDPFFAPVAGDKPKKTDGEDEGDYTSRLLAAKRRARGGADDSPKKNDAGGGTGGGTGGGAGGGNG